MKETVDDHSLITWSGKLEEPTMELTLRSHYSTFIFSYFSVSYYFSMVLMIRRGEEVATLKGHSVIITNKE